MGAKRSAATAARLALLPALRLVHTCGIEEAAAALGHITRIEAEAGFALRHQPEQNSTMVRFLSSIVGYGVANALLGAFAGKTLRDVMCATPADLQKGCPQ